nr:hypothetical protein [Tanacetum cinerariifolium]
TEEEILDFLRFLGHSHEIRYLTDVNVNKLYQPWRSFTSVINKCLTGKSYGVDSFRLSQAQMLWGFYHRINIDFAYLIWEDFVYQVEHKNQKRSNEMYYPRFTKVIIDYFMTRKPSISRRNRINWHYVRDDVLFSTIKVGGDEVSESEGESDEEETRQEEEESFDPIPRTPEESEEESNDEEDQELSLSEEARIQEEEDAGELYRDVNINQERGLQVTQNVEDSHVTLTPVNPDGPQESSSVSSFVTSMLNPTSDVGVELIFTTASSPIVSLQTPTLIMNPSTIATITTSSEAPIPPPTIPSIILKNLPTFNSAFCFDERLRSLETSFFEYR